MQKTVIERIYDDFPKETIVIKDKDSFLKDLFIKVSAFLFTFIFMIMLFSFRNPVATFLGNFPY